MKLSLRKVRAKKMQTLGTKGCILGRRIRKKYPPMRLKGVDCTDNC